MSDEIRLPKTVVVQKDLAQLLPQFFQSRRDNVRDLRIHAASKDWDKISRIGHVMAGICGSFGFDQMGELGRHIETLSKQKKADDVMTIAGDIEKNLDEVRVVYEEE